MPLHPTPVTPDAGDDTPPRVTVLDVETGRTVATTGPRAWEWTDNNWSCDCNRAGLFGQDDAAGLGPCAGATRYVVIAVDPMPDGCSIRDFNQDYPEAIRGGLSPEHPATRPDVSAPATPAAGRRR